MRNLEYQDSYLLGRYNNLSVRRLGLIDSYLPDRFESMLGDINDSIKCEKDIIGVVYELLESYNPEFIWIPEYIIETGIKIKECYFLKLANKDLLLFDEIITGDMIKVSLDFFCMKEDNIELCRKMRGGAFGVTANIPLNKSFSNSDMIKKYIEQFLLYSINLSKFTNNI